jgi:hypothetical protein
MSPRWKPYSQPAMVEFVHDAQPELCSLALLYPDAQYIIGPSRWMPNARYTALFLTVRVSPTFKLRFRRIGPVEKLLGCQDGRLASATHDVGPGRGQTLFRKRERGRWTGQAVWSRGAPLLLSSGEFMRTMRRNRSRR